MRCLLDVMMAGDEMMRLLMFPVPFHPPFPFALPPLPGSSRFACFCLFPRPRVVGGAGGCRFAAAGGWQSACLSSSPCRSLAHRSFAFPVGLRLSASLLAWFRRRLCCRVVSYSIPDDVIRITGSCGIRLVVYPACLPIVVSVPRAMWAAVSSRSSCRRSCGSSPVPLRLPALFLLLTFHRFPIVMALASYRLPLRSSPRFAPSPRQSCRGTGRHRIAYRHAGRLLAWRAVLFLSKNSPR